eukprot:CAMPEP_0194720534 /NCGR_PEP_ID=MMETSP0296-20130528/11867_1 /TAXON_ID=39354 /ORGANISM="Heterosigma akashiwo, Strain CCMP2393" /LENGTH=44 /DNA_ID= /DNA_START= /DNA_END= /DNA_ORIENTATION=
MALKRAGKIQQEQHPDISESAAKTSSPSHRPSRSISPIAMALKR